MKGLQIIYIPSITVKHIVKVVMVDMVATEVMGITSKDQLSFMVNGNNLMKQSQRIWK